MRKSGRFSFGRLAAGRFTRTNVVTNDTGDLIRQVTVTASGPFQAFVDLTLTGSGGTAYSYVSTDPLAPTQSDWTSGAGAVFHSAAQVAPVATQSAGPSGLAPSTDYVLHLLYIHSDGREAARSVPFTTNAIPTTVPLVSVATVTVTDETTLSLAIEGYESNGALYWMATTDAMAPNADDIRDGLGRPSQDAVAAGRMTLSSSGPDINTAQITGLAAVPHWLHFLHEDPLTDAVSEFSDGPFTPRDNTVPIISSFEKTALVNGTADFAFNTDTPEGMVRLVALSAGVPMPDAAQIMAGTDASDQPAPNVLIDIATAGHKAIRLAALPVGPPHDFHIAHQDATGNQSEVHSDFAKIARSGILWSEWSDGKATGEVLGGLTVSDGYPDQNGRPNAILMSNDGNGNTQMIKFTDHHDPIHANAPTWISLKAKAVAHTSEKAWLRFHFVDFRFSEYGWVDITDDGTALNARTGFFTKGIQDVIVSDAGDGYFNIRIEFDGTKLIDSHGRILFRYTSQNRKLAIQSNDTPGAFQLAITDIRAGII